jgi:hypothetical protein
MQEDAVIAHLDLGTTDMEIVTIHPEDEIPTLVALIIVSFETHS